MSFFCGGKFSGLNDGDDNIIDYLQNVKWYGYSLEPKKKKGGGGGGIKSISHFTVEIKHKPMYLCLTISLTLLGYGPVKEDLINTKSIFDVCNTTA